MSTLANTLRQPFAYAYGRTAILRMHLLTEGDVNRLLGASTGKDAITMFTELPMTKFISQGIKDPNQILYAVFHWLEAEVIGMSPSDLWPIFEILWLEDIGTLVSLYLKQEAGLLTNKSTAAESFVSHELQPIWQKFLTTKDATILPTNLRTLLERCKQYTATDPKAIDLFVSQEVTLLKTKLAKQSGSKLIKRYVQDSIDLKNIRIKLRLDSAYTAELFLPGGALPVTAFSGTIAQLLTKIEQSKLSYTLAESIRSSDTASIEKTCNSILVHTISTMWNTTLSIESTFAFAAITVHNLKLLRSILIGKQNGLSPQEIKAIIPPFIPPSMYTV